MIEKSTHPKCKICGAHHSMRDGHSWDKPSGTKEQRLQIADAVLTEKSRASAPLANPVRATGGRRKKALAGNAPGVNERPETGGKLVEVQQPSPTTKPRGRPKLVDDRKAYLAQKARERRARQKAEKPDAS